ncbi:putative membrane protein affecting hemolysin expression [Pseudomonas duriflava]|uniref:Putative membrane protein affecting hemolysin expression n=1 Tax=Pseudomonas duriflava TaxID=459528 RepID=A0A562Q8P8_9PSED|nr:AhpA/YtjB family protein [Pseudomonas duriflava]TWI52406.1 putative membrane protein affecting hemolysin expression [Pseudomonas duriflava]
MTRPATVKPDNFFLLLFRALRQRRIPIALRVVSHSLILVIAALLIYAVVMGMQFRHAMQQQADAIGQTLVRQTAASATELLVSNDTLSLNVLLGNLARNPLVAHAAVFSPDNRILAEAGTRPTRSLLGETEGIYSTPIKFQDVTTGQLRLSLDMNEFQQPMMISLQNMALLGLILLALTLILSLRLGRNLSTPLLELRVWLRDPDDPAPSAGRLDEIGDLARQLQTRLVPEKPKPAKPKRSSKVSKVAPADTIEGDEDNPFLDERAGIKVRPTPSAKPAKPVAVPDGDSDEFDDDAFADVMPDLEEAEDEGKNKAASAPVTPAMANEPDIVSTAVLAIQLGSQEQLRKLPRARLVDLLERYKHCLEQATQLYKGELHSLIDGGSLILFHETNDDDDYLTHALCCGEIMRALGHALQVEVADSGITLQLQLGLTHGERLVKLKLPELLANETVRSAIMLSQHSRNLLLVERSIAEDALLRERARIRSIASPEGASCVERLLEPYSSTLERHLVRLETR